MKKNKDNFDGIVKTHEYYFNKCQSIFKKTYLTIGVFGLVAIGSEVALGVIGNHIQDKVQDEARADYQEYVENKKSEYQQEVISGNLSFDDYYAKVNDIEDINAYLKSNGTPAQLAQLDKADKLHTAMLAFSLPFIAATIIPTGAVGVVKYNHYEKLKAKAPYECELNLSRKKDEDEKENAEGLENE